MKSIAVAAVLALAASATTAQAVDCLADINALTTALTPIVNPANSCQTATGYTIITPIALPTADEIKAICSKCEPLITGAKAIKFPDCTLTVASKAYPLGELFDQIVGQCGSTSKAESGNSTAMNTTEPATPAPATTTTAPTRAKEAGSTSGSSKSASTVDTPAPTKATTTAAPKSAASRVSATICAAVVVAFSVAATAL